MEITFTQLPVILESLGAHDSGSNSHFRHFGQFSAVSLGTERVTLFT